jgi:hypothetical protein
MGAPSRNRLALRRLLAGLLCAAASSRALAAPTAGQAILASVINPASPPATQSPGVLEGLLSLAHPPGAVGAPVEFVMTVRNTGGTSVTNVVAILTAGGQAAITGPSPNGLIEIAPGSSVAFTWTVIPGESGAMPLVGVASGFTNTGSGAVAVTSAEASAVLPGLQAVGMNETYVFPSPARGAARIAYRMAEAGFVRIRVYNGAGQLVDELTESRASGTQSTGISTDRLAPGVYFYLLDRTYASGRTDRLGVHKFVVARR